MHIDKQLQFSDDQLVTANTVSTNVVNLSVDRDIGIGETIGVVFNVSISAESAGGETYTFEIETDDNESFLSFSIIQSVTVPPADLKEGDSFTILFPFKNEQYLRIGYVTSGAAPNIGISAHLNPEDLIDADRDYASGYTIN